MDGVNLEELRKALGVAQEALAKLEQLMPAGDPSEEQTAHIDGATDESSGFHEGDEQVKTSVVDAASEGGDEAENDGDEDDSPQGAEADEGDEDLRKRQAAAALRRVMDESA